MQIGNDQNIIRRLFKYGSSLFMETNKNTILLALVNVDTFNDIFCSKTINLIEKKNASGEEKKLDFLEIIIINLKEEIEKIKNKKRVTVMDKELGETGINWIKLLGFRHFEKHHKNYYYLPKNIEFNSKEINSAFKILQSINDFELRNCIDQEEFASGLLSTNQKIGEEKGREEGLKEGIKIGEEKGREEGLKEGIKIGEEKGKQDGLKEGKEDNILNVLINFFNEKKENLVFENLIDIVDKEKIIFRRDKIKSKIKDEQNYKNFISLLGKKRKII